LDKKTGAVSVARMLDRSEAAVVRITVKVVDTSARIVQEGLGRNIINRKVQHIYLLMFHQAHWLSQLLE
jgi:hypothetical protein